jgi:methionyl-tRNA synthetase
MSKKKFYITTAIDYVNAEPHIGHAFEKVIADALARWQRQKKNEVFFLTGVDENAQKNVQAAEKQGVQVKEFIDKNTNFFKELCKELNISHDKFIRTSANEHSKVVEKILRKIIDKGDIYKGEYEGDYCVGCEAYLTEKDLVDGKCPEHNKKPEHKKEEAYFFKLSKYKNKLIKFIENYIIPESRKKEILSRLKEDLRDVCISRKGAKWGIDFPDDKNFKVWVWVDALINYVSGAEEKWPTDLHIVGKGINWFHSVIWPAILMSAGIELPKKLLVHGYLNINGQKMSKSLGNVINPIELLKKYGADAVRYSLLRCSVFEDSDYSEELLISRYNNELADKLGNLVSRVSALIEKFGVEKAENKLLKKLNIRKIELLFENYELDKVLNEIFAFIDTCNEYVQNKKPWETGDKKVLYELKESILKIADLLLPFIPESAEKIKKQFRTKNIKKGEILFKKIK